MQRTTIPAALLLLPVSLCAQWLNFKPPGIPRTPGGKPDLTAPAPRTQDGHRDLSGLWAPGASRPNWFPTDNRIGWFYPEPRPPMDQPRVYRPGI